MALVLSGGDLDELIMFVDSNKQLNSTFKSQIQTWSWCWLIATSKDSLGTYRQHVRHRPKPLGIIKSRKAKVAPGQPVILVTIIAPCSYAPLARPWLKWIGLSQVKSDLAAAARRVSVRGSCFHFHLLQTALFFLLSSPADGLFWCSLGQ